MHLILAVSPSAIHTRPFSSQLTSMILSNEPPHVMYRRNFPSWSSRWMHLFSRSASKMLPLGSVVTPLGLNGLSKVSNTSPQYLKRNFPSSFITTRAVESETHMSPFFLFSVRKKAWPFELYRAFLLLSYWNSRFFGSLLNILTTLDCALSPRRR